MNEKPDYLPPEDILREHEQKRPLTRQRRQRLQQVASQRQRDLLVLMENVHNPHNLAAIARTCDAFGVQNLAFTVEDIDPFNPPDVGKLAAASASKWLDYHLYTSGTQTALAELKTEGYTLVGALVQPESVSIHDVDFLGMNRIALMMGNEHDGLSATAQALVDVPVYIPMMGFIESFNVSVATAILLYEITRQRRASGQDYSLPPETAQNLYEDFRRR